MKENLKMKFNLVYENVMEEIAESEKMLTEGVMKKLGSAIAAGTLAATAAMTPANVEAAPVKNQQKEIQSNVNEANQLIGYAMRLLKYFEGSVKDSKGNHIVYDDADNKHRWNGKQDINEFIKSCRGKATIGYGETASNIVKKGKISDSEANQLLQKQIVSLNNKLIDKFGKAYSRLSIVQKSVLISFYYNLGINFEAPKMEANLRAGKLKEAAHEFLDCDNTTVDGVKQKSPGLTKRRRIEHNLFIQGLK